LVPCRSPCCRAKGRREIQLGRQRWPFWPQLATMRKSKYVDEAVHAALTNLDARPARQVK
jgi:hypothetical protein